MPRLRFGFLGLLRIIRQFQPRAVYVDNERCNHGFPNIVTLAMAQLNGCGTFRFSPGVYSRQRLRPDRSYRIGTEIANLQC